ncbi:nuclear transport factor 2 family protein [Mucilaginibacter corticis]|uniref:Nuclear transport factor 2 family protein n=1 Tax=Mucilaginibacter corticis TaxID=2597670 RepID=A0A556MX02_9SPHI|nr:nuclear transport factor 2 family protein [Mucilaginibacter corticis]TSJ44464.1 nuclear transport factor 2 family protein [Mucilaginibacter corticis]
MKKINLFLLSLGLFAFINHANAQNDSTTKAHQILRLEQQLADALQIDTALWSKYLDPTWHIVDEDGNGMFKKEFLTSFKPFPKSIAIHAEVTKPVFSFHGDVAVVQYVADEYETAYGQQVHTTYGTMDVWYRKGDSWRMLSMEDFEIPALPPAVKVSDDILKSYTGTYRLDDDHIAIVELKDGNLNLQKNKGAIVPLHAETYNVFFRKEDARGRKLFVKDENGQWQLRERRNGQDLVWRRIN